MLSAAKAARSHSSDGRQSEGAPPVALLLRGGERAARRAALLHVGERVARRAALQHGGKLVTYQTVRCGLLHVLPAPRSRVSLLRPEGQLVQCCFGPRIGCRRGTAAHGVGGDTGGRRSDGSGNEHAVVVGGGGTRACRRRGLETRCCTMSADGRRVYRRHAFVHVAGEGVAVWWVQTLCSMVLAARDGRWDDGHN